MKRLAFLVSELRKGIIVLSILLTAAIVLVSLNPVDSLVGAPWVTREPMQVARSNLGIAEVNGKIYAIGGSTKEVTSPDDFTGGATGIVEEYDPVTDRWTFKKSMPTPRSSFAITVLDNKIYCIGGSSGNVNEVYDPATNTWETKTSMPTPRIGLRANMVNGKIYLIGGQAPGVYTVDNSTSLDLNEEYDPITDRWITKKPIPNATMGYASAVFNDKLFIFSGFNYTDLYDVQKKIQIYDPKTDSWSFGNRSPNFITYAQTGVIVDKNSSKKIYFFDLLLGTFVFDPVADTWSEGAEMPNQRGSFSIATFNNTMYAIGGSQVTQLERYGPYTLKVYALNDQYLPDKDKLKQYIPGPSATPTETNNETNTDTSTPMPAEEQVSSTIAVAALVAIAAITIGLLYYKKRVTAS